ncbi:hypothetical protein PV327_002351, partial [Microctonus hyperodae]
ERRKHLLTVPTDEISVKWLRKLQGNSDSEFTVKIRGVALGLSEYCMAFAQTVALYVIPVDTIFWYFSYGGAKKEGKYFIFDVMTTSTRAFPEFTFLI